MLVGLSLKSGLHCGRRGNGRWGALQVSDRPGTATGGPVRKYRSPGCAAYGPTGLAFVCGCKRIALASLKNKKKKNCPRPLACVRVAPRHGSPTVSYGSHRSLRNGSSVNHPCINSPMLTHGSEANQATSCRRFGSEEVHVQLSNIYMAFQLGMHAPMAYIALHHQSITYLTW